MHTVLILLAIVLFGAAVLHIVIGLRIFAPDRAAARRQPGEHLFAGPPESEAGRYSTLVGSFHALGVNWAAIAALLLVIAAHPGEPLTRPLLAIVVVWGAGNLACALRWVTWNRIAQGIFIAIAVAALVTLLA